jgi:uncharacterized membrane protein YkoI
MSKKYLLTLIVCAAAFAATDAVADTRQVSSNAESRGADAQANPEEAAIRRVLEEFRATQVSLSQAMSIAERLHDSSKTTDISFEISGPPVYRVRTVRNERVWENVIDANTGTVSDKETTFSLSELNREDLANIIALEWIKQKLSDAVRVAEGAAAGRALAGGLMKQDNKLNFVVVVASGDRLNEVMLEPPKMVRNRSTHR